ncbi:hypothetical protein BDP27DRAFT_1445053 [Rhodocollybia butyracea]|uniref:Uncharacterized protein n=1 Tax=Rhodocollybia butyracea TaxID=206335 RepID=A0A9P5Q3J2_9AGAR|nr:hypothetical protein BDP27DRAFT_1445053 [Rhodocollybia butyracea]
MASAKVGFENASKFTIQGSEFNTVAGDQLITVNHNTNYVGDSPSTQLISGRRFRVIPDGDVFVLRTRLSVSKDSQDKVRAVRSISTVQVVGLGESRNFTAVTYEGPQSKEAFENDLIQYSQSRRHHNFAQLFGVVHGASAPALIFHSELIPLKYFAKLCSSSPLALAYLKYRYSLDSLETVMSIYTYNHMWNIPDKSELYWMQPTSGLICTGPLAPSSNLESMQESHHLWNQVDQLQRIVPPLGFAHYTSDRDVIKHIEDHFGTVVSFVALLLGNKAGVVVNGSGHLFRFGSVVSMDYYPPQDPPKPRRIIAQISPTSKVPYLVGRWINIFGTALELHSSGWARVLYGSEKPLYPSFRCDIKAHLSTNDIQSAWLSQAECILENIEQKYVLFSSEIKMTLDTMSQPRMGPNSYKNTYLFIAPVEVTEIESIPYFSFNVQPYFWSFDENGAQPISRTTQDLLGLPSFEARVAGGKSWSTIEHMAVSQYLKSKGFSSGMKYSCKHGYPLFQGPENTVTNDEFEIIEAVKDTEDDWELIPEDKVYHSSDVSMNQWLL